MNPTGEPSGATRPGSRFRAMRHVLDTCVHCTRHRRYHDPAGACPSDDEVRRMRRMLAPGDPPAPLAGTWSRATA